MFGVQIPTSDIILVGIILGFITVSITLGVVTLAKAIRNRKVNERTYALVNNFLCSQLKVQAISLRRLADLTGDPDDIIAAMEADRAFREHKEREGCC